MPARDRTPLPRASPSSTVSAWSSRVCPSSRTASRCSARTASAAYRAIAGGGLGSTVTAGRRRRSGRRQGRSRARAVGPRPLRRPASEPSCSPWSTTAAPTSQPALTALEDGCSGQSRRVGAAGAGDDDDRSRLEVGARVAHGAAYGRNRWVESTTHIGSRQPWTRATQAAGSPISSLRGRFAGSAHTALKPSMPTLSSDAADEHRAVAVLAQLRVEAEQPPDHLVERAGTCAARGELRPDVRRRTG